MRREMGKRPGTEKGVGRRGVGVGGVRGERERGRKPTFCRTWGSRVTGIWCVLGGVGRSQVWT